MSIGTSSLLKENDEHSYGYSTESDLVMWKDRILSDLVIVFELGTDGSKQFDLTPLV